MIEELNIGTDPDAAAWHIQMMAEKGYKHLGSYMNGDFQIGKFEKLNPAVGIQEPITLSPRSRSGWHVCALSQVSDGSSVGSISRKGWVQCLWKPSS